MINSSEKIHAHWAPRATLALMLAGWIGFLLLTSTGCRTARDNQFDILERELRTQEDYIYELEDYVVEYSQKLRQCRCAQPIPESANSYKSKSVLKKSKAADKDDRRQGDMRIEALEIEEGPLYEPENDSPDSLQQPEDMVPPVLELEETRPNELEIPELEISEPLGYSEGSTAPRFTNDLQNSTTVIEDDQVLLIPNPISVEDPGPLDEPQQIITAEHRGEPLEGSSEPAERVVIAQLFRDEAGDAPPQTMLAVVEAHTADDQPVEFSGEVSLMVMTGDSKKPLRLKRWDFDLEDAASAWQSSHLGDGLHLELPLEKTELPDIPLELWVRIVGPDGRKLLSQLPFKQAELIALEVDTGAQELIADSGPVADQGSEPSLQTTQDRSLASEEQTSDKQSGWKAAKEWADFESPELDSNVKKTSGWIAQPAGGRFPQNLSATVVQSTTTSEKQPVWKAGRVNSASSTNAVRDSRPQWSPWR